MHDRWIATLIVLCATTAHADDDSISPCRPTITCTASLATPGLLELEVGYQLRRVAGGELQDGTPFLAKLPLSSSIEVQLGGNGYTIADDARYFDNVVLGGKMHVADHPSLAVTVALSLPTVAQRGYDRHDDLFVTAHASTDIARFHFDANVGVDAWALEASARYQPWAAVAASFAATKQLAVVLEPHAFADAAPVAARDLGAIAAVTYAIRNWLVIDGAIDVVYRDQRSVTGIVGLSIAPAQLWVVH